MTGNLSSAVKKTRGQGRCKEIKAENQQLKTQLDQQARDIQRLQDDNSQLKNTNQDLQDEKSRLERKIQELQHENSQPKNCPDIRVNPNVAKGKPASQSSTFGVGNPHAGKAVDGNFNTNFYGYSCAVTGARDFSPWWQVDLGQEMNVIGVVITNRGDCCGERLQNFYVKVYKQTPTAYPSATGITCLHYPGALGNGVTQSLYCDDVTRGRYVRFSKNSEYFQLCEVQVRVRVLFLLGLSVASFIQVGNTLDFSPSPKDRDIVYACLGDTADFPWQLALTSGDTVSGIQWLYVAGERKPMASKTGGQFTPTSDYARRVSPLGDAGIRLSRVSRADEGSYVVKVSGQDASGNSKDVQRTLVLRVLSDADGPLVFGGRLQVDQSPSAVNQSDQWHLELTCGIFVFQGKPPVDVVWTTPSGSTVPSSSYSKGKFRLLLAGPVRGGNYSCHVRQNSPATHCLFPAGSELRSASVAVAGTPTMETPVDDEKCEGVQAENQRLKTQLDQQARDIQRLQNDNSQLENTTQDLQEEKSRLEKDIQKLQDEISRLKNCSQEDEISPPIGTSRSNPH